MFKKKENLPSPKPDPPWTIQSLLVALITVCFLGFSFSVSNLRDINYHLRREQTNQRTRLSAPSLAPYPK